MVSRPGLGTTAFVIFAALSALLAFFSSAVLVPVAVQAWGHALTLFLLWTGWTLGGVCAYTLGRVFGRAVVGSFVSLQTLDHFEHRVSARTPFTVALLFQLAVPSEIPGYVLGLGRYSFAKYLMVVGLGELPFALGTVYIGHSFLERRTLVLLAVGAAGVLLSAWALYTLQRKLSA
jgi:uncharacterized membrane protein YdjX (TVP38/TMEM64 family)